MVNGFYTRVKNIATTPRWIIFILDLVICAFALFFAFLLRFNMNYDTVMTWDLTTPILVVTCLNFIFFRIFHTYVGIIRLSSSKEGIRVVSAVFYSTFILFLSIPVTDYFHLPQLVPFSILAIYFFTASFLIYVYRFWVKQFYYKIIKAKKNCEKVVLFGKTFDGVLLKRALETIEGRSYKVVGFIDPNKSLWGKSINNAKICSLDQAKVIIERKKVKLLFLTSDAMDSQLKDDVINYCLVKNIGVKVIPEMHNWIDGRLHKKILRRLKIEDVLNRPCIELELMNVKGYLPGKTILVTGAAGSIGSEIVRQLIGLNAKLLILCDNRETGLYDLQNQLHQLYGSRENIIISVSDVRSSDRMQHLFETYRPQIVFHAAAYKHVPLMELNPCEAVENNVLGTKIVADLSVAYCVECLVFISTDKAVNPTNVMGASKRIAEIYISDLQSNQHAIKGILLERYSRNLSGFREIRNCTTKIITTRFGNVLGSNGSVIPLFQEQIEKGGPVTVTHRDVVRFFMTIQEACSLVLEAGAMGNGGEVFVFDMGEPVRIADLANKMIKLEGFVPEKDIRIEYIGLRPGEKLYEELLNKNEEVIPTHNKKIMISRVGRSEVRNLSSNVEFLISLAKENNNTLLVKQMKKLVPEYKSENSIYEELDVVDKNEDHQLQPNYSY
jgi:FlaA1/EpsC-like NDP-sugar epimerase